MRYSIGKDSSVMLQIAHDLKISRNDCFSRRHGSAPRHGSYRPCERRGLGARRYPIASGSALHTQVMKTEALRQALDKYKFDAAFGAARRDEEKSRAKERIFSHRTVAHA